MDDQGLGVPDVGEVAHELRRLDERLARVASSADAEGEDRACALRQVFLRQSVVGAGFQARIAHPAHQGMGFEEAGGAERVRAVPVHAHVQGLQPLQEEEGIERARRGAEGAQRLAARAHRESEVAEGLVEAYPVVSARGLRHARELAVVPRELPGLDHHPADRRPVPADELRGGVGDEIRPPFEGAAQVGCREGVVDHQRQPRIAGHCRHRLDVEHVDERVPDGLGEHHPRVVADGAREVLRLVRVHERGLDAEACGSSRRAGSSCRRRACSTRRRGPPLRAGSGTRSSGPTSPKRWPPRPGRLRAPPCAPRTWRWWGSSAACRCSRRSGG